LGRFTEDHLPAEAAEALLEIVTGAARPAEPLHKTFLSVSLIIGLHLKLDMVK
jgi:hypothetical protein